MTDRYPMLVAEVAALLAAHGGLRCSPSAEFSRAEDDELVLTIRLPRIPSIGDVDARVRAHAQTANLFHALDYLRDTATMRAVAIKYDIPIEAFEALMPEQED
jgi:hypothetical protein